MEHTLTGKIARNTLVQIAGKAAGLVASVLTIALITRGLGSTGFGHYATVLALLQVAAAVADLGLQMTAVQLLSRPGSDAGRMLGNLLGLRLATTAVALAAAVLVGINLPYPPAVKLGLLIAAGAYVGAAVTSVLSGWFQSQLAMGWVAASDLIGKIALLLLVWTAVSGRGDLTGVLAATTGASMLAAAVLLARAGRHLPLRPRFEPAVWREILAFTWPLALTIAFNLIYFKADTVVLSLTRPAAEVGLYGAAYRILELAISLAYLFLGLLLPLLAAAAARDDRPALRRVLQRGFDAMVFAGVPLVAGAAVIGRPLMALVAGEPFALAGDVLLPLMVATAVIFIAALFGYGVVALGKQRQLIALYAANAAVTLAAYLWAIPRWGMWAAAYLTIASEVITLLGAAWVVWRQTKFLPRLAASARSLIAGLVLYAALVPLASVPVLLRLTLGGALYLGLGVLLGVVPRSALLTWRPSGAKQ